ncbi:MAG: zinc-binding dehydrogenase [Pseudomonadota bacterium]
MRAILLQAPDQPGDALRVVEAEKPVPGVGEVLVEVAYGGCNYADTMMRDGTYPHPKGYPLIAGLELSGRVVAVGEGVSDLTLGMAVAAFSEDAGGFAQYCAVPAERCIPLPDGLGLDLGAAFVIQGLTAFHLLHTVSTTRPGDLLLIHAIGGGVGLYLTQLAVAAGARVIGTVGTPGKEKRALEYGAEQVFNREEKDFVDAIVAHTDGRELDKVLDSTGATILDRSFGLMRKLGHVVSYGEAEGRPFPNLWERLVERSLTFTRFHLGHSDFGSQAWLNGWTKVTAGLVDGQLKAPIEAVYPFEAVGEMYDALRSRKISGKLLLAVNPDL